IGCDVANCECVWSSVGDKPPTRRKDQTAINGASHVRRGFVERVLFGEAGQQHKVPARAKKVVRIISIKTISVPLLSSAGLRPHDAGPERRMKSKIRDAIRTALAAENRLDRLSTRYAHRIAQGRNVIGRVIMVLVIVAGSPHGLSEIVRA